MQRTCKEHAKNMQHAEHNTILKEHTDNGHHCQTSVCKFSIQLGFLHRGVRDLAQEGRKSNAIVARSSRHGGILHEAQAILSGEESRSLNQANEPQDLVPAKRLNSKSLQTWQVHEDIHAGTCWSTWMHCNISKYIQSLVTSSQQLSATNCSGVRDHDTSWKWVLQHASCHDMSLYACILYIYMYIYIIYIFVMFHHFPKLIRFSKLKAGTFEMAARPPGTSLNFRPREGLK